MNKFEHSIHWPFWTKVDGVWLSFKLTDKVLIDVIMEPWIVIKLFVGYTG